MMNISDPDMHEIVVEFCAESDILLKELTDQLDEFEEQPDVVAHLEKYGQVVDRMMGAAATLGLEDIANLCKMGKIIGYKSSQSDNKALNEVTCGVLFDLSDLLETLINNLREQKTEHDFDIPSFSSRLQWLAEKFKHIDRSSCDFVEEEDDDALSSAELDDLISSLDDF